MLYFAYGSNMLRQRISHPLRVPGAMWLQPGYVTGRKLAFHKRSRDGSGKCDIPVSACLSDRVYGVVYDVPAAEVAALDAAEAVGFGYRRTSIKVLSNDRPPLTAHTYLGEPAFLDSSLSPYRWYKELVLCGARQNGLPDAVLDAIHQLPALEDPRPGRPTALEAAQVLETYWGTVLRQPVSSA